MVYCKLFLKILHQKSNVSSLIHNKFYGNFPAQFILGYDGHWQTQACSTCPKNSSSSVGKCPNSRRVRDWLPVDFHEPSSGRISNFLTMQLWIHSHITSVFRGTVTSLVPIEPKVQPSVSAVIAPIIHQSILVTGVRISKFTPEFDVPYRLFETPHDCLQVLLEPPPSSQQNCNYLSVY